MDEVWGYSLPAIATLVALAQARLRMQLHDLTVAVRHSQGTDAKTFDDFLKHLRGDE